MSGEQRDEHPEMTAGTLLQIQQQFQQIAAQVERLYQQVATVQTASNQQSQQLDALISQLTNSEEVSPLLTGMADLTTVLDETQEQLVELTQRTARQEQLERLVEVVAGQSQLDALAADLKKLTRTQFKSNTLAEGKSKQVEQALATLRTLATQRENCADAENTQRNQQVTAAHAAGRTEFAIELLSALDSLELALNHGADLQDRQQERANELTTLLTRWATEHGQASTPAAGFWQRIFGSPTVTSAASPAQNAPPTATIDEFATGTGQAVAAWIQGLVLVHERLLALLEQEEIQRIEALNQPFDPRLHVAVESVRRDDVASDTVVKVLRHGYRQRGHVMRYAEVVVARTADG